jgi:mannose-6-phosphate isomerase-like protein (cupin superfamily)
MGPRIVAPEELKAYRFQPSDHCRLAIVSDPETTGTNLTLLLEIHDPSDRVPAHRHHHAVELYFILRGQVVFHVENRTIKASTGDSVMVPEGALHDFENPGPGRTYILSVLSRDDGFSKQLQSSIPTPIDAEDLQVLRNL